MHQQPLIYNIPSKIATCPKGHLEESIFNYFQKSVRVKISLIPLGDHSIFSKVRNHQEAR